MMDHRGWWPRLIDTFGDMEARAEKMRREKYEKDFELRSLLAEIERKWKREDEYAARNKMADVKAGAADTVEMKTKTTEENSHPDDKAATATVKSSGDGDF